MPKCLQYSNDYTDEHGVDYSIYFSQPLELETCSTVDGNNIILSQTEYSILTTQADMITTIDDATGLIDPLEISATFGTSFALIFAMAALAYKIKVGKRVIKMA